MKKKTKVTNTHKNAIHSLLNNEELNSNGKIKQCDVAKTLSLSPSTISSVNKEMELKQCIYELKEENTKLKEHIHNLENRKPLIELKLTEPKDLYN